MHPETILITCPGCGFSRQVQREAIPPRAVRVTCPRCREQFPLAESLRDTPVPLAAQNQGPPGEPVVVAHGTEPADAAVAETVERPEPVPFRRPVTAQTLRFSFAGTARDYFGIWVVNTLLKIITLGGYSAWAKVRKRRWFYGNTMLQGAPFEYVADPKILFRGWLVGAAALVLYTLVNRLSPSLSSLFGLAFVLAMPWLVVRSRLFNNRNSLYRNIRFDFRPEYREASWVFVGLYFLMFFTLGLIFPFALYRQKKFLVENSEYGRSSFSFAARGRDYYLIFAKAAGLFIAAAVILGLVAFGLSGPLREVASSLAGGAPDQVALPQAATVLAFIPLALLALLYLVAGVYLQTALANLGWNATRLGGVTFASTLRTRDMAWLYLSNAVAIFCSLGLLIPWASVRLARYRLEHLTVTTRDGLDGFAGVAAEEVGAAGEEIVDLFGIDVGF